MAKALYVTRQAIPSEANGDSALLGYFGQCIIAMLVTLAFTSMIAVALLPNGTRLSDNFSAAFLARKCAALGSGDTLILGDSVLYGYRVRPEQTAFHLLSTPARRYANFAFEGGSVAGSYALIAYMLHHHVRPHAIIVNLNLKEFNPADAAYEKLPPAVEQIAWNDLRPVQRARLKPVLPTTFEARLDRFVESIWPAYALRDDIREALFQHADAAETVAAIVHDLSGETARKYTDEDQPEKFLSTYDLEPLTADNVQVRFLDDLVALAKSENLRLTFLITPTNHVLLHNEIDVPEYQDQLNFLIRHASRNGLPVINVDASVPGRYFFDNDHLTAAGQLVFARYLRRALRETAP